MDSYLDIELRPDPEISPNHLMGALYSRIHLALVARSDGGVAVYFPGYQLRPIWLGTRLRLLGSRAELQGVEGNDWLGGVRDHVQIHPVAAVPDDAKHCAVRRVQAKSNPARLRRRLMKRHDISAAQALERIPDSAAEFVDLPFVQLQSGSNGQPFRLFLSVGPALETATPGEFNSYGLSQTASVPWF